ncbi:hypothetical protein CDL12_06077 [Handroanthus impetiginosus]|uniref:Uncharacterized protein n=1 Tax=Handroanthus impetiginosus TaxID=429701 RepID=A0A2G9HUP2_9LAMI|nr:hypothetical protein CDL12_06077 [Handroanthus impetiginosus]
MKQKPAAPQAERPHCVRKRQPQWHKHHPRLNIHPPQQRPRQQYHRYPREHALEPHHRRHRIVRCRHRRLHRPVVEVVDGGGQRRLLDQEALPQRRAGFAPEGEELLPEGHLVGPYDPADDDGGESVEGHESGVDGPFLFNDAAVEDDEAGDALEADEGGGGHLPGVVAFVQPVGDGGGRVGLVSLWYGCSVGSHSI